MLPERGESFHVVPSANASEVSFISSSHRANPCRRVNQAPTDLGILLARRRGEQIETGIESNPHYPPRSGAAAIRVPRRAIQVLPDERKSPIGRPRASEKRYYHIKGAAISRDSRFPFVRHSCHPLRVLILTKGPPLCNRET